MATNETEKAPQPATEAPQAPPAGRQEETPRRGSRWLWGIQDSLAGEVRPLKGGWD